jgi:LPXTG-motif cell wall-anchored protein
MRDLLQRFKKRKILNLTVASLFMALQMPLGLIGTNSVLAATEQSAAVQNEAAVLKADNRNEAAENAPNQESENTSELNQEQPILNENQPSEESNVPDNQGTEQAPGLKEEHESQDVNQENQNQAPQVLQLVSEESEGPMVTLCHATGSTTNPFVRITISVSGAFNGHLGNDHQNGEDIIPPFEFEGQTYSQNWDVAGQATFNNNCVRPSGGQGGGEVLGESTTVTPTGAVLGASTQLANTGESTMSGLFVALAILGLTGISAYSTRRRYNL